jgi:hypothetical protein
MASDRSGGAAGRPWRQGIAAAGAEQGAARLGARGEREIDGRRNAGRMRSCLRRRGKEVCVCAERRELGRGRGVGSHLLFSGDTRELGRAVQPPLFSSVDALFSTRFFHHSRKLVDKR